MDWGQHPVVQGAAVAATFNGDSVPVCFQTRVGPAKCTADQSITNTGNVVTSGSNNVTDSPDGNNTGDATFVLAAEPTTAGCSADLSITKTPDATTVAPGGQVMYTLLVQNHGPVTGTSVNVSDAVPAGLTVVSAQPSQGSCKVTTTVECSLGTILNGGSAQILVAANVAPGATGSIINTANVSGFQTDTNTSNNDSGATIHVVPPPSGGAQRVDVQVVKHVNHGVARFGQVLTYTLDVEEQRAGHSAERGDHRHVGGGDAGGVDQAVAGDLRQGRAV